MMTAEFLNDPKHIVVIGGGITGLSASWHLQNKSQTPLKITLVESSPELGGKMSTRKIINDRGSFVIDAGPEVIVTRKPEAWQLALALDLEDQIVNPGNETKDMFVLDGGEPKEIPLSPFAFLSSDLLSIGGKIRMMMEPLIPPKKDFEDESLADFVTRRLGREALDKMLGPVLAGIYNTDPETQSILTTSPVMREMEREHGGLFKGTFARMRAKKNAPAEDPPRPQFITFTEGAQVLVNELASRLSAQILLGNPVVSLSKNGQRYQVSVADGRKFPADAVILSTPANQSAKILGGIAPGSSELLNKIKHENIGTAALIFKEGQINIPYAINGLMIPRRENRRIDAVSWTTNKPLDRAPAGYEMLRVFFGGSDPSLVSQTHEQIILAIREELEDIFGILAEPVQTTVFCWPDSFPQAYVNHLDLVDEIEKSLPAGIYVAGSSYRGIGIPDCIRQGQNAAESVLDHLLFAQAEESIK